MQGPPSPEQRAMMDKARADAEAAAYLVLTPAHKERVTAIIADVAAGTRRRNRGVTCAGRWAARRRDRPDHRRPIA